MWYVNMLLNVLRLEEISDGFNHDNPLKTPNDQDFFVQNCILKQHGRLPVGQSHLKPSDFCSFGHD